MSESQFTYQTILEMLLEIGLSREDIANILRTYEVPEIHKYACYTIFNWRHNQCVMVPPAWFKSAIRNKWSAPRNWDAGDVTVFHFRVDESTWAEMRKNPCCSYCAEDHPSDQCPHLQRS